MNSRVLQLSLQRVCYCMALARLLGVHTPHKEVDNSHAKVCVMSSLC